MLQLHIVAGRHSSNSQMIIKWLIYYIFGNILQHKNKFKVNLVVSDVLINHSHYKQVEGYGIVSRCSWPPPAYFGLSTTYSIHTHISPMWLGTTPINITG